MKYCRYVCAGTNHGEVHLLDPANLNVIMAWQAHSTAINWMDAQNNYLVTCGWSTRANGARMLDAFAKVYDLRDKKQLAPISFPAGAAYIQMHPRMSTTGVVASQAGQLQVIDIHNPNTSNLHHAGIVYPNSLRALVMAPSGDAWGMLDNDNAIHVWGSPDRLQYAERKNGTEFADPSGVTTSISWDGDHPFSSVGMPHYREKLLSAWAADDVFEVGYLPPRIDPDLIKSMSATSIGYRAPNSGKLRQNQIQRHHLTDWDDHGLSAPKFLSERSRGRDSDVKNGRRISDAELLANVALAGSTKADVPVMYRNVEIKYSKFGVDDFDFKYYNKTQYSGLETHITNSYLNPLLQLLKYIPIFRNVALQHAAGGCLSERCLLCEMGYLFDMIEKAAGQSCQATNFLKAFSGIPESTSTPKYNRLLAYSQLARRWYISEDASTQLQNSLDSRIQSATHFLMERIALDATRISEMELMKLNSVSGWKKSWSFRTLAATFSDIVTNSFHRESEKKGFCNRCKKYAPISSRPEIRAVPPVLLFNANLDSNTDSRHLWSTPGWLPTEIAIVPHGRSVLCFEGEALQDLLRAKPEAENMIYELVGFVADINIAISDQDPTVEDRWHLFNDFLVRKVPQHEALRLSTAWKMPTVLAFQLRGGRHYIDDSWKNCLDTRCLYMEYSMNHTEHSQNGWVLKHSLEDPQAGTHVAIDSEFVALQQEEIEIKADGDREVIRPTRLGLARVSVLRGSGIHEGVPFINDYIKTYEPVVDYLTKYSGLQEGDLDPLTSSHVLVPLKVAYKKLWLLLNLGCIFIGHGLPSDFRTINIHVPPSQVLDTVSLFHIRTQKRKLSLRFLTWYFLKEDIQQETHDSIEDARMALKLWRKHEEFKDAGIVAQMIEEIYARGRKYGYKPPSEQAAAAAAGGGGNGGRLLVADARSTELGGASSGTETPPIIREAASGPHTPLAKKLSRESEYFESPLR
ncbi:MAG: hypothetical protein Q9191_005520 [Dirinaria sp. TL-2023a]